MRSLSGIPTLQTKISMEGHMPALHLWSDLIATQGEEQVTSLIIPICSLQLCSD